MNEKGFGIFSDFWDGFPYHLPLLNLHIDKNEINQGKLNKGLERLDLICFNKNQDLVINGIQELLSSENWRPHLVAILASFKLSVNKQKELIPDFWNRLERDSWISPQILSVLSMIDHEFESIGLEILKNGFQVTQSPMSGPEHYSTRGPEGKYGGIG